MRLAARDMRKHRGRAALVVLLIGLPLLLVSAGATFGFTKDVNAAEGIARTMGASQALLTRTGDSGNYAVVQSPDGRTWGGDASDTRPALRFPGEPERPTASDIQQVTGGSVLPVSTQYVRVAVGDRRVRADSLGIDGRNKAYDGMARLTSGRWPTRSGEVLVSGAGSAHGIPDSGSLTMFTNAGRATKLTVVGRADTPNAEDLVALPTAHTDSWILERGTPVQWSEVRQLNRYGLAVSSREVIHHPDQAGADPLTQGMEYSPFPQTVWVLLGVGLVIVIALLAGPAFAAGGVRHRRALAQLASNGATKSQLRRYVLSQALLLGALSAVVSIVLGAVAGGTAAELYGHFSPTSAAPGPIELRWGWGLLLFAVAVFASLVAAFVPAVAAVRVNLIAVLRGHVSAAKVRVGWPILGLVLAVAGGVTLTVALVSSGVHARDVSPALTAGTIVGAVALFIGTLMTAPWLLTRLGMLAQHLPLSFRVATRDISRQRGRAVATTGAILATVAALTTLSIGFASSDAVAANAYQPSLKMGQGLLTDAFGGDLRSATATVRHALPDAQLVQLRGFGTSPSGSQPGQAFAAYTSGCTDAQALRTEESADGSGSCNPVVGVDGSIVAATPEQLGSAYRLSDGEVAALRSGHIVLPASALGGHRTAMIRLVAGKQHGSRLSSVRGVTLPISVAAQQTFTMAPPKRSSFSSYGMGVPAVALVSTATAAKIPGDGFAAGLWVHAPHGISSAAERTINEHLADSTTFYVERGYDVPGAWIFWLIGGVFGLLVLVATLASTALSNAESRGDSATFASLGAPASLRRKIAGANAAVVGLFGALLGLVIGVVAGIAVSHPVTLVTDPNARHTVTAIPWLQMLTVVIGVPLLAAALAALATRGRVPMTRRVT